MRPSSIAQGLKSWASKLHPQLPLTNQESSRLLNALTSAFRQKLDEAHPDGRKAAGRQAISSKPVPSSAIAFHSSAAHADKHLESVLTNPLLGGRVLDYGTAKVELTKNPHRDPIELLEDYHDKGAASVAIAELCLAHFRQTIERLPRSKQQVCIHGTQAGRRVFKWLLDSNMYESKSFVENLTFIDHLVFLLVREGREDDIWSWIKLDIGNTDDLPLNEAGEKRQISRKTNNYYKYRWRGRILRALVAAKLVPIDADRIGPGPNEIRAAIDTIIKMCDLKSSAAHSDHLQWTPLAPVTTLMGRFLMQELHVVRRDLDMVQFEQLFDRLPVLFDHAPPFLLELKRAKLLMIHPKGRQPTKAFECFQELFGEKPSNDALRCLHSIRTGSNPSVHAWWAFITATIHALRQQGRTKDAEWLGARSIEEFPRQAHSFDARLAEYRRYDMGRGARLEQAEVQDQIRILLPSLA